MSPPRATHDADCTDDSSSSLNLAPAYPYLLPSAFPVGFKLRTNPSQNHRVSFTVMTSLCREGDMK